MLIKLKFSSFYFLNSKLLTKRYLLKTNNQELHLTVADSDCLVSPYLLKDLNKALKIGVFPYIYYHQEDLKAINNWYNLQNQPLEVDNYLPGEGVIQLLQLALSTLTSKNDAIIVNLPAYKPFLDSIKNLGLNLVENELNRVNYKYQIDFESLEKAIKLHSPKVFIFCNPHNPTGRVFSNDDLIKILKLASEYHFFVISDEIWQDIYYYHRPVPIIKATNSQELLKFAISISSFATTFNFFSVHFGYLLSWNKELIQKLKDADAKINWQPSSSVFNHLLLSSSYLNPKNMEWLDGKLAYLKNCFLKLKSNLQSKTKIIVTESEATTLAWLDFSNHVKDEVELKERFKKIAIFPIFGADFGQQYKFFVRINYFLELSQLETLILRLVSEFSD